MAQRWLLRSFYVVRACGGVGLIVEWALSWSGPPGPLTAHVFQRFNFVRTPRCARDRGPGGPHYVQNLHTYRTSTRTEPPHVQNLHTYRTSTRTEPPHLQNRTTYKRALSKYRTAPRTYGTALRTTASVRIISIGRRFVHRAILLAQRLVQAVGLRGFLVGCVWSQ